MNKTGILILNPTAAAAEFQQGYAEYFGGRMILTQRVVWDSSWKFVLNGFDFDELYKLDEDSHELSNRIDDPDCDAVLCHMCWLLWDYIRKTNDRSLLSSNYPILRVAPYGPEIEDPLA